MKRKWRWPLAGFVLGAVVGATVLTANVVGASSPERVAVRAAGFGEILHPPVLLARAGESVELSFDVVCGTRKDAPENRTAIRRGPSSCVQSVAPHSRSCRSSESLTACCPGSFRPARR